MAARPGGSLTALSWVTNADAIVLVTLLVRPGGLPATSGGGACR